jgi:hypothetical protein
LQVGCGKTSYDNFHEKPAYGHLLTTRFALTNIAYPPGAEYKHRMVYEKAFVITDDEEIKQPN